MNPVAFSANPTQTAAAPAAARRLLQLLSRMSHGTLELQAPDGHVHRLGRGPRRASMWVNDWSVAARTFASGDIGFAEAYLDGAWGTSDLSGLLTLLLAERQALEQLVHGTWWGQWAHRLRHALNRNTRRGSAKNVHAHYDLGNDFYRLWLDPTMSYSSAWFEGDLDRPLAQAQDAKMRRALTEAGAGPGRRVLEIGCGWGSLARMAATEFGAELTGVTLSTEQLAWGRAQLSEAGVTGCDLRLQDYRDLPAGAQPFDAVVSIEMFEAVGREYWRDYFDTLARCLRPGGRACIQSITIQDALFERYVRSTDFIQQYIFPGGLLPSVSAFEEEARRGGFVVERRLHFGADYAETLRRWRLAFQSREAEVLTLGFDERFLRTWHFYLAYCEAAFALGSTDVVQFTLLRPERP